MTQATLCLWYEGDAEAAAHFYAATFPDSHVGAVHLAPKILTGAVKQGGEVAKRAFEAMFPMKKIDVAVIEAAIRG